MGSFFRLWPVIGIVNLIAVLAVIVHLGQCDNVQHIGSIDCTQRLDKLNLPSEQLEIMAECPSSCLEGFCRVRGSSPYTASSSCCCAAIHHGSIKNETGGLIHIRINHKAVSPSYGSFQNGVTSRSFSSRTYWTFTFIAIAQPSTTMGNNQTHTQTAGTTTAIVTSHTTEIMKTTSSMTITTSEEGEQRTDVSETSLPATSTETTSTRSTTQTEETSRSFTTSLFPVLSEITSTTQIAGFNVTVSGGDSISIQHSHFVLYLVAVFITGIILTLTAIFLGRKLRRKKRWRKNSNCRSTVKSESNTEQAEYCVCYTNVNESKQGLLTDPETCSRPCPNRNLEDEQGYVMVEQKSSGHDMNTEEIHVEDCASRCSKKCCPEKYEF